jgi:signal transduction histidine kinase
MPDTVVLKNLIRHAIVLYPDKTDSIKYYADLIEAKSTSLSFNYGLVYVNRLRGSYHRFQDNYDSAIIYFQRFRDEGIKHQIPMAIWLGTSDVADIYMNIGQYETAKRLYFEAHKWTPKIVTNRKEYAHIYSGIGDAYQYLNMYDSARLYFLMAIENDAVTNDSVRISERKSNLSEVLMAMGRLQEAEKYLLESYNFNRRRNLIDAIGYNLINLGRLYLLKGEYSISERFFNQAMVAASKTTQKFKQSDALNGLADLYKERKEFKKALEYKWKADSIYKRSTFEIKAQNFKALEERHLKAKKEKENYELYKKLETEHKQSRQLYSLLIGLLLTLIVFGIVFFLYYKKNVLLAEKSAIISKQNEKLVELNMEKNGIISYVSHDLATPLVHIILSVKSIRKELEAGIVSDKVLKSLSSVEDASEFGYGLIQKILRMEESDFLPGAVSIEKVDLYSLINQLQELFIESFKHKGISLQLINNCPNQFVVSDHNCLLRILENLISNALKFSLPGKSVTLKVFCNKENTVIEVKDEGPGIQQLDKEKLFYRYTRLSNKPTNNESSSGLGLFIVKRLADEINVRIKVDSEPGKGSVFSVIIPS